MNSEITILKNHGKSQSHQRMLNTKYNSVPISTYYKPPNCATEFKVKSAEKKLTAFLIEHNILFNAADHLTSLFNQLFDDLKSVPSVKLKLGKQKQ